MSDLLKLGDYTFSSRLFVGTGKFSDINVMTEALKASGAQLVTVALRRFNPGNKLDDLYQPLSMMPSVTIIPNTSGARNADEAVKAAMLGREITGMPFVKLEIHPNPHHLLPDPIETHKAAIELVREGFVVLPYISPDPVLAKRLEDAGCSAVMPLGSTIGSGKGISAGAMVEIIVRDSLVPVIVDAGLRSPSEAAAAMEMGCDAVLVNSAIAAASDPVNMARAFKDSVVAGRTAFLAGLMPRSASPVPTSPLTSFLSSSDSGEG